VVRVSMPNARAGGSASGNFWKSALFA
jgi:hypothetical protein